MQKTFDDVVLAGQEGIRFGQQQRQYQQQQADQQKERALMDESEQAVRGVMKQDMDEWVSAGNDPSAYKPTPRAMLRSVEARSAAFAKAGDLRRLLENEVMAEKPRMQMRARALQQYEATGKSNFGEFAKEFYSTLPNGVDVVGYEEVRGGPADAPKGAPSGPTKYRLKFSNGKSELVDPEKLYASAQQMLQDPVATAKQMAEVAVLRQTEAVKGEEARKTERLKGEEARKTAAVRTEGTLAAVDARGEVAKDVANIRVNGSLSVAQLRGTGGGRGGRGGSLADAGPKVQSRMTDANGNVILVMRDGTHKALVGDDGQPVKSLDYQKLLGSTTTAISRNTGDDIPKSREAAKNLLKPDQQAPVKRPATPGVMRFDRNGNPVN